MCRWATCCVNVRLSSKNIVGIGNGKEAVGTQIVGLGEVNASVRSLEARGSVPYTCRCYPRCHIYETENRTSEL